MPHGNWFDELAYEIGSLILGLAMLVVLGAIWYVAGALLSAPVARIWEDLRYPMRMCTMCFAWEHPMPRDLNGKRVCGECQRIRSSMLYRTWMEATPGQRANLRVALISLGATGIPGNEVQRFVWWIERVEAGPHPRPRRHERR